MAEGEECRNDLGGSREEIFKLRYAFSKEEDWKTASERVARVVGAAEENAGQREEWIARFKEILENFYFIPGGRIIRNAGRKRGMLLNCFVQYLVFTDSSIIFASSYLLLANRKLPNL